MRRRLGASVLPPRRNKGGTRRSAPKVFADLGDRGSVAKISQFKLAMRALIDTEL